MALRPFAFHCLLINSFQSITEDRIPWEIVASELIYFPILTANSEIEVKTGQVLDIGSFSRSSGPIARMMK
jgi:hypothetical protein